MFEKSPITIYSDRDKIRDQIIEYMQEYLELDDIDLSKTSYLSYLINVMSVLTSNLIYYSSSVYREFFLTKAVQKESILNWASMLGYSPDLAVPATCEVLVSIPLAMTEDVEVTIPSRFKYYAGNIIFEQQNEIQLKVLNPGTGAIIVTVTEILSVGGMRSIPFEYNSDKSYIHFLVNTVQETAEEFEYIVSNLQPYEFYKRDVEFTGNLSSLSVTSTEEDSDVIITWSQYDSLFLIPAQTSGYSYRSYLSGIRLFFGNDIIGRQPEDGTIFTIQIGTTAGANGNVIAGSISKSDKLFTKITAKPVKIEVINVSPAQGGEDAPIIDLIRSRSMANVASAKRLVTTWDYQNIDDIVLDLPVQHATPLMKRSDIKRNEICLFTDIIFQNIVVPTRDTPWTLDTTAYYDSTYKIFAGDIITINDDDYYSLFNIDIDAIAKESDYYFIIRDTDAALTLNRTYSSATEVLPVYANFDTTVSTIDPISDYVTVTLYYQQVEEGDYSDMSGVIYASYDQAEIPMIHDYANKKFTIDLLLADIPNDEQTFYFSLRKTDVEYYCDSQCEIVIKRDLSEFMYSQVSTITTDSTVSVTVYDVPVIKKDYYDSLDDNIFKLNIIQKIISFDVINYRMMTDFLNLKFSNTTGKMTNMNYNPTTRVDVVTCDPLTIPSPPVDGRRYLVTARSNHWNKDPVFITFYNSATLSWVYEYLRTDDIIYVQDQEKKLLYNGETMVSMSELNIPFEISIIVWKDSLSTIDSQTLVTMIKDELVNVFYQRFGYDQNIYRSEIISVTQGVEGVEHCELESPEHDIFFNFDIYKDFTQLELLIYAPDLIYFDTSSINIEIR